MRPSSWSLLPLLFALGCSSPKIPEGRYTCALDAECPPSFSCHGDGLCYRAPAGDGGADLGTDASSPCTPTGDYVETNDATNDGVAEATGIELGNTARTIGGCIDPAQAEAGRADEDRYIITQPTSATVFLDSHFVRAAADGSSTVVFELVTSDLDVVPVATVTAGDARITPFKLDQGVYTLRVRDTSPAAVTAAYSYSFRLRTVSCTWTPPTITYSEANDGADDQGNDVLSVVGTPPMTPTVTLTASTTDAPEVIATTIVPGTPMRFTGFLAVPNLATGDAYRERDLYELQTTPDTHAVLIGVGTSTIGEVHALVTTETLASTGDVLAFQRIDTDATMGALVPAGGKLWFWLGSLDGALGYSIGVCAIRD